MGVGTLGLSEAIRPALSKTWQNNMDNAGSFGVAPALAIMNKKNTAPAPAPAVPPPASPYASSTKPNQSSLLAIEAVKKQNSNAGMNTGYLTN